MAETTARCPARCGLRQQAPPQVWKHAAADGLNSLSPHPSDSAHGVLPEPSFDTRKATTFPSAAPDCTDGDPIFVMWRLSQVTRQPAGEPSAAGTPRPRTCQLRSPAAELTLRQPRMKAPPRHLQLLRLSRPLPNWRRSPPTTRSRRRGRRGGCGRPPTARRRTRAAPQPLRLPLLRVRRRKQLPQLYRWILLHTETRSRDSSSCSNISRSRSRASLQRRTRPCWPRWGRRRCHSHPRSHQQQEQDQQQRVRLRQLQQIRRRRRWRGPPRLQQQRPRATLRLRPAVSSGHPTLEHSSAAAAAGGSSRDAAGELAKPAAAGSQACI